MCDDGISYFDYTDCLAELVKTDHIRSEGGKYSLTAKGARNGGITENSLPYSVRAKVENSTALYRAAQSRNAMIKTSHTTNLDGSCTVSLALSDGVGDIVSMELFAANEKQAIGLEDGFRKSAESIYNALIGMIIN